MRVKKSTVPEGKCGDWEVKRFTIDNRGAFIHNLRELMHNTHRYVSPEVYTMLTHRGGLICSDTPAERRDMLPFMKNAMGTVLISGLGLGVVVVALCELDGVDKVIVNEISKEVIDLVYPHIQHEKLVINHADVWKWHPGKERFNTMWHDIWPVISEDLVEDSKKLHRRYAHWLKKGGWQKSWGRDLLRCYYKEEIL